MRFKILLVTNKDKATAADAEMLRERGMLVYTCDSSIAAEMVGEIVPDVVLVNPNEPDASLTKSYHSLLQQKKDMNIPVIYTLAEDELYLINIRRRNKIERRTADNIIDSIKTSLTDVIAHNKSKSYNLPAGNYRQRRA